jgi:hypothetical protein
LDSTADIVYFGATSRYADTGKEAARHIHMMEQLNNYKSGDQESEDRLKFGFINPVCKLIRHSLIKENLIRFDEVMYSNDIMFSTYTANYAQNIMVDKTPIYCINVISGSLVNRISKDSVLCRFRVNLRRNQFLRGIGMAKYQVSVVNHLLFAIKKGPCFFYEFLKLVFKYNANPFIGYNRWLNTALMIFKQKKEIGKYKVYE